jgi:hypothetical protein
MARITQSDVTRGVSRVRRRALPWHSGTSRVNGVRNGPNGLALNGGTLSIMGAGENNGSPTVAFLIRPF